MKRQVIGVGVALLSGLSVFADLVFECHPSQYDWPIAFEESVVNGFSNGKGYLLGAYDTDFQNPLGLTLECSMTYTITGSVENAKFRVDTYNDPGTASFSPKLHFKNVSYTGSSVKTGQNTPFCSTLLAAFYIGTWSASNPSGMTFTGEGVNTITGPLNTPAVRTEAKSSGDYANAYLYIKSGTFVFSHGEADADSKYWEGRGQELTDVHAVRFYIEGGSVILKHKKSAYLPYLFKSTTRVYGVERTGFAPGSPVSIYSANLPNYNFSNIYADTEGKICLWIPAGTYDMTINGVDEQWTVSGGADALYGTVSVKGGAITSTGVLIDSLGDVIAGTNKDVSADWWFRAEGANKYELHLVRGNHTLSGENYDGQVRVVVGPGVESLTIENLKLDIGSSSAAAIALEDGANVPITVKGYCQLTGGLNRPAILVPAAEESFATLTLTAADTNQVLIAQGGGNAAGIGGAFHDSQDSHQPFGWDGTSDNRYNARCEVGKIIINGGYIEATGGEGVLVVGESGYHNGSSSTTGGGAGIGAAIYGLATHPIVINGGHVIARGGSAGAGSWGGAGIGSGLAWSSSSHVSGKADVERVEIHGGFVDAQGGRTLTGATGQASGIGTGDFGTVKEIVIDGGTVSAWADGGAAAIGAGYSGHTGKIVINGGEVSASASSGAAIGGAQNYAPASPCTVEGIFISNGVVNASVSGTTAGAAIGGGYLQAGGRIEIAGGQITAQGSGGSAAIGTGYNTAVEDRQQTVIRVTGGTVIARGSKAWNGQSCPGIGSGVYTLTKGTRHVTDLTITGGSIRSLDAAGNANPSELGSGDAKRVCRTITLDGYANTRVTALQLESGAAAIDYGFNGVWTDDAGKLYLWFPESIDVSDTGDWTFQYEENGQTLSLHGGEVSLFSSGVFVNGEELTAFTRNGDGWEWNNDYGVLTISGNEHLTLSGQSAKTVTIYWESPEASVTLSDLTLRQGGHIETAVSADAKTLNLFLSGVNAVETDSTFNPAIWVTKNITLVITNAPGAVDAVLTASVPTNNTGCAAIGGKEDMGFGTIRIQGGNVIARGGNGSAAIGGGSGSSSSGTVEISGGYVDARATVGGGAGIGAGENGDFGSITITGGTVEARCADGEDGSSLGCASGHTGKIGITGGSVIMDDAYPSPKNEALGESVSLYDYVISGYDAGEPVSSLEIELGGDEVEDVKYGTHDIVADESGEIHLWLPENSVISDGARLFTLTWYQDGWSWETKTVEITPVYVNGVNVLFGESENGDWTYADHTLTLKGDGQFTLSGSNTVDCVHVVVEGESAVTLSNLVLEATSASPIALADGADVTLNLEGVNVLKVTSGKSAALCVSEGSKIRIQANARDADASLGVEALGDGAAIGSSGGDYGDYYGGGELRPCGTVEIVSGTINARSNSGAAIGGGAFAEGGTVRISGGVVNATVGGSSACIGAGFESTGGLVEISGGQVTASAADGAGIGGSYGAYGGLNPGRVIISGGFVSASSRQAAGIGAARWCTESYVEITGGTIYATGGMDESTNLRFSDIGCYHDEYSSESAATNLFLGGSINAANAKSIWPKPIDLTGQELVTTTMTNLPPLAEVSFAGSAQGLFADKRTGTVGLWIPKGEEFVEKDPVFVDGKRYEVTSVDAVVTWPVWPDDVKTEEVADFRIVGGTNVELVVSFWSRLNFNGRYHAFSCKRLGVDDWVKYDDDSETRYADDGEPGYDSELKTLTFSLPIPMDGEEKAKSQFYMVLPYTNFDPNPDRRTVVTVEPAPPTTP